MTQPKKSGIGPTTIKWIWAIAFAPFVLLALMLALTALGVLGADQRYFPGGFNLSNT